MSTHARTRRPAPMGERRRTRAPGACATARTTTPSSGRGRCGDEDMRAHARGRRQHRLARHLLVGAARAAAEASGTSAGSTRSWTCCTTSGIDVDLATATASPPPWLTTAHPEILPVTADGRPCWPGRPPALAPDLRRSSASTRCGSCARSPSATPSHPALVAWHISNELGCHNVFDYSDDAARAFRDWLRERYADARRAQRRLGHRLLVAALRRLGRDPAAAARRHPPQPGSAARLRALLVRRAARLPARGARRAAPRSPPTCPCTTNFMVTEVFPSIDYADVGRRRRLRLERPLPAARAAAVATSCRSRRTSPATSPAGGRGS